MSDPVPPIDVAGSAIGATLVTIVVTPMVSLLVLGWFRRTLARSMRASVGPSTSRAAALLPATGGGSEGRWSGRPRLDVLEVGGARRTLLHRGPLTTLAVEQVRRAIGWYVAAGAAYAVTAAVVLLMLDGQELLPLRTATVAFVFAWPLVGVPVVIAQKTTKFGICPGRG